MGISPELEVESNILEHIKTNLGEMLFPGAEGNNTLFFAQGFIPTTDYSEKLENGVIDLKARINTANGSEGSELKNTIPLCLVKAKKTKQIVTAGVHDAGTKIEIVVGTYDDSKEGYQSVYELMGEVKTLLLEEPHVEGLFSIKTDKEFTTELEEEISGGDYWFGKLSFEVYIRAIKPTPIDFEKLLKRSRNG